MVNREEGAQTRFIAALQNLQKSIAPDEEAAFTLISEAADDEQAPLLVLSEQAAWRHSTRTGSTVYVIYPEDGTYTLDYPYVLRTNDPEVQLAAEDFRAFLTSRTAQEVIRADGFRSADDSIDPAVLTEELGLPPRTPR